MRSLPAIRPTARASATGFTLIEFIIVMALLATVMALVAPSLSSSIRRRGLDHEAARFVALTEYGRDEAVSAGEPMVIWVEPETSRFGLKPKTGYTLRHQAPLEFRLADQVRFELDLGAGVGGQPPVMEFAPDGALEMHSLPGLRLVHDSGSSLIVVQTTNGWGYEVLRESEYANRPIIQKP